MAAYMYEMISYFCILFSYKKQAQTNFFSK
nr:MAG TPA: hypothetical protein [Bacteriophage sp.]DAV71218.1 MAG TPA: hypothetical protein [Bacteriophage sp.]